MKIRFEFFNEVLDRYEVETMHADVVDESKGHYKLDNITFFVKGYASDDIVKAEKVDEGFPLVTGLVKESGNSTINIIFFTRKDSCDNEEYKTETLKRLHELGAEYEGAEPIIKGYYSVNVPKDKDYKRVFDFLLNEKERLDFREACIGHKLKK